MPVEHESIQTVTIRIVKLETKELIYIHVILLTCSIQHSLVVCHNFLMITSKPTYILRLYENTLPVAFQDYNV